MVAKKSVKKVTKTPARKTPTRKKPSARKSTAKKVEEMRSFRLYKNQTDFVSFRITRQTVYWSILLAVIVFTQLWILNIQMEIADLTNALLAEQ
ncbi:MAG TPA: hypothetical protein QF549_00545 [Candidatus Saccharimonadaceae bacterium]|mgnify:FL=1|nr:hypothetical protein [Candidatus Saccharimonadaceae bacterium]